MSPEPTSLQTRFYHHKSTASSGGGYNSKLYNAMRKLGIEHFYIALLRNDATSIEDLLAQETAAIEEFDTVERGYNASLGGTIGLVSPIIVDGKQYMSRGQAAAFYGIDAYNFNQRISKLGWTPDEAAELVDRPKFGRRNRIWSVDYKGERLEFSSQTKAAEHFGIKRGTVHMRISKGWSLAQALGIQPPPKKEKE